VPDIALKAEESTTKVARNRKKIVGCISIIIIFDVVVDNLEKQKRVSGGGVC